MVTRPIERRWATMKSSRPDGEKGRTERCGRARQSGTCPTAVPAVGFAGCSDGAKPFVSTHSPCLKRGDPDAIGRSFPKCLLAGRGTSGLIPGRRLALKPEGPFTPMDGRDGLAPTSGKSPISPLLPIHRKTVPLVLTWIPDRSDTLATTAHVITTVPVITPCSP